MHSHNFIVELVIAVGGGEERVTVCYEHVEKVHYLGKDTRQKINKPKTCFLKGNQRAIKHVCDWIHAHSWPH